MKKKMYINEEGKRTFPDEAVPRSLAMEYGFKPEYVDRSNGLEIWGRRIASEKEGQNILWGLGLRRFNTWNANGHVRITVKPDDKPKLSKERQKKIGDYETTGYGDKYNELFENMKKKITLNESTLYRLISESVKNVLREATGPEEMGGNSDMYVMSYCAYGDVMDSDSEPYEEAFQSMKEEYEYTLQYAREHNLKITSCFIDKYDAEVKFENGEDDCSWSLIPEDEYDDEEYDDDYE